MKYYNDCGERYAINCLPINIQLTGTIIHEVFRLGPSATLQVSKPRM